MLPTMRACVQKGAVVSRQTISYPAMSLSVFAVHCNSVSVPNARVTMPTLGGAVAVSFMFEQIALVSP